MSHAKHPEVLGQKPWDHADTGSSMALAGHPGRRHRLGYGTTLTSDNIFSPLQTLSSSLRALPDARAGPCRARSRGHPLCRATRPHRGTAPGWISKHRAAKGTQIHPHPRSKSCTGIQAVVLVRFPAGCPQLSRTPGCGAGLVSPEAGPALRRGRIGSGWMQHPFVSLPLSCLAAFLQILGMLPCVALAEFWGQTR